MRILAVARTTAGTGVEMEALAAVSVAGLTVYDMCKAADKEMQIGSIKLVYKAGGRRGEYVSRAAEDEALVTDLKARGIIPT